LLIALLGNQKNLITNKEKTSQMSKHAVILNFLIGVFNRKMHWKYRR